MHGDYSLYVSSGEEFESEHDWEEEGGKEKVEEDENVTEFPVDRKCAKR